MSGKIVFQTIHVMSSIFHTVFQISNVIILLINNSHQKCQFYFYWKDCEVLNINTQKLSSSFGSEGSTLFNLLLGIFQIAIQSY